MINEVKVKLRKKSLGGHMVRNKKVLKKAKGKTFI